MLVVVVVGTAATAIRLAGGHTQQYGSILTNLDLPRTPAGQQQGIIDILYTLDH
jgi:hypothetical protein